MGFGFEARTRAPHGGQVCFSDEPMKVLRVLHPAGLDMANALRTTGDQLMPVSGPPGLQMPVTVCNPTGAQPIPVSGPPGLDMPVTPHNNGNQPMMVASPWVYAGRSQYESRNASSEKTSQVLLLSECLLAKRCVLAPPGVWAKPRSCSGVSGSTSGGSAKSSSDCEDETNGSLASKQTTVMMRSIPNKLTRDTLVRLLDVQGFAYCYNFVYLPIDLQTGAACGYAFINFFAHDDAERFREHFDAFVSWPMISEKVCQTAWSNLDGLQAHVNRYRNSPVQHESVSDNLKPALFDKNGSRVPFPSPTKKICPPASNELKMQTRQMSTGCS